MNTLEARNNAYAATCYLKYVSFQRVSRSLYTNKSTRKPECMPQRIYMHQNIRIIRMHAYMHLRLASPIL